MAAEEVETEAVGRVERVGIRKDAVIRIETRPNVQDCDRELGN